MKIRILVSIFLYFVVNNINAQNKLHPERTAIPPVIDGKLNEDIWNTDMFVSNFKSYEPDFKGKMSENTQVYFSYDSDNLYFAFKCEDKNPEKIKSSVTKRDNIMSDDWICISLDTDCTSQNIFRFYVNPAGIQSDSYYANGGHEDFNFDIVWFSSSEIHKTGYNIEIKIPLKSIRFPRKEENIMNVFFERAISRKSEKGSFPDLNPETGQELINKMINIVYKGLHSHKIFEILPSVTLNKRYSGHEGKLEEEYYNKDIGLSAKYGLTSDLILEMTYNPDYSHVESDAGQIDINLRHLLYYPEKRPFFQEGRDLNVLAHTPPFDPLGAIVHTRNMLEPKIGLKLTGKLREKNQLYMLYTLDDADYTFHDKTIDKTNFSVLRYKRALHKDSHIAGIFTEKSSISSDNKVLGFDGFFRINEKSNIYFHTYKSFDKNKINFQKTEGITSTVNYGFDSRRVGIGFGLVNMSKDFNTEVGYLTRKGIISFGGGMRFSFFPENSIINRIEPLFLSFHTYDKFFHMWEKRNGIILSFVLPRSTNFSFGIDNSNEIYLNNIFVTSNLDVDFSSQITNKIRITSSFRYGKKIRYIDIPYQGKGLDIFFETIFEPTLNFNTSFSSTYSNFYKNSNSEKVYGYYILRLKNTYQVNKYLFLRIIGEYNNFYKKFTNDFLVSFTYIPGTVIYAGYGSIYERLKWENGRYVTDPDFHLSKKGVFFKASYLWRN